jgi:hypothetical protein
MSLSEVLAIVYFLGLLSLGIGVCVYVWVKNRKNEP